MKIGLGPLLAVLAAAAAAAGTVATRAKPGTADARGAIVLTVGALIIAMRPGPPPVGSLLAIALVLAAVAGHNFLTAP